MCPTLVDGKPEDTSQLEMGPSDDVSELADEAVVTAREKFCVSFDQLEYDFLEPDHLPPDDKMGFVYAQQPSTTTARDFSIL